MSILRLWWRRALAWANAPTARAPHAEHNPEAMSLRDWSDLPTHHPCRDKAPC